MQGKTYTPGEIARFCDVYPSTVNNWIKKGNLKAFSTPGGHNRILKEDLVTFLKDFSVPMPEELRNAPPRVLLVDDEPAMIGMLEHAFSLYPGSFACESRANGFGALTAIGENKPALVVLDIMMPEMDGWAVIDHLKAGPKTREIRIIVLSGQKPLPTPEQIQAHKVDAFFEKPFDVLSFLDTAARLLGVTLPKLPG